MTKPDRIVQRVRHEAPLRLLDVVEVTRIAPHMIRLVLTGKALDGFISAGFDDHVKIFVPPPGSPAPILPALSPDGPRYPEGTIPPALRDFTPRSYDAVSQQLTIDFALHEAGPATEWAEAVQPGDKLGVGGPRGSFIIPFNFDWHLLVGDETALPAIGRRLDELPPEARVLAVIEIENESERLQLGGGIHAEKIWVHRDGGIRGIADRLLATLQAASFPQGDYYAWIACESDAAKRIRQYLLSDRGANKAWLRAAGYWRRGAVSIHETHSD